VVRSSNLGANLAHESEAKKKLAALNSIEKKRASLDIRHKYVIEKFGQYIDEKPAVLENSLLLGTKLELLNEFFADGGNRKVLLFWQKVPWSLLRMKPTTLKDP
jgi:dynein heavy chain, axonemal